MRNLGFQLLTLLPLLAGLAALAGCGGGGDDQDVAPVKQPQYTTPISECKVRPELCQ